MDQATKENVMIVPLKTIPITAYCKICNTSLEQINMRLQRGIWQLGIHVLKVDNCKERYIDLEEVDKWVRKNKYQCHGV